MYEVHASYPNTVSNDIKKEFIALLSSAYQQLDISRNTKHGKDATCSDAINNMFEGFILAGIAAIPIDVLSADDRLKFNPTVRSRFASAFGNVRGKFEEKFTKKQRLV